MTGDVWQITQNSNETNAKAAIYAWQKLQAQNTVVCMFDDMID